MTSHRQNCTGTAGRQRPLAAGASFRQWRGGEGTRGKCADALLLGVVRPERATMSNRRRFCAAATDRRGLCLRPAAH